LSIITSLSGWQQGATAVCCPNQQPVIVQCFDTVAQLEGRHSFGLQKILLSVTLENKRLVDQRSGLLSSAGNLEKTVGRK